jgi:hypothetical protein
VIVVRLLSGETIVREVVLRHGVLLVGRGPESDLVVADPTVSRAHARVRIEGDGTAWIEDAGGRHGLLVGESRVERLAVTAGAPVRCQLGTAVLEVAFVPRDATLDLPAPVAGGPRRHGPWRALQASGYWAASVAGAVALMAASPEFWSPWEQGRATWITWTALAAAVGVLAALMLLMGILRVVGRRAPFRGGLRAFAIVAWTWVLVTIAMEALSYGLSVSAHGVALAVVGCAVPAASVAFLASLSRPGPRRRFFLAWMGAAGLFVAALQAAAALAARQAGTPAVDYAAAPPLAGLTGPAADLEPYLDGVRKTFRLAAERAAEERQRSDAAR